MSLPAPNLPHPRVRHKMVGEDGFRVEFKEYVCFQMSPPSSLCPLLPLESNIGHEADNHRSQDGAVDRNEVVRGASGHYRLGAAHHSGHHICHRAGYGVLIWRRLRLLGAGGRAVRALCGCRPCDPSVRDLWGTGPQELGPTQAFPLARALQCLIMSLQSPVPGTRGQAVMHGVGGWDCAHESREWRRARAA